MSAMHRNTLRFLAFLIPIWAAPAYSQLFSVGVKGGIPATDAFQNNFSGAYQRHYIVGPTAEVHLPLHLSFEVDALYRRSGFTSSGTTYADGSPPIPPVQRARVNDWQIPFLGKWTPGSGPIRPFIDGGVSYRHVSGESTAQGLSRLGSFSGSAIASSADTAGGTVGGGLTVKLLLVRLSAEIRYTHWNSPAYIGNFVTARMSANQADFLVGLTF